jgi:hypothetical protein
MGALALEKEKIGNPIKVPEFTPHKTRGTRSSRMTERKNSASARWELAKSFAKSATPSPRYGMSRASRKNELAPLLIPVAQKRSSETLRASLLSSDAAA